MITFLYTNHKGETRPRRLEPDSLEFLFSPGFGYQPGWFLSGHDLDKDARRSFALSHVRFEEDENAPSQMKTFLLARLGETKPVSENLAFHTKEGKIFWSTKCENATAAIEFALDNIEEPFHRTDFLIAWREGDVGDWPEFIAKVEGAKP